MWHYYWWLFLMAPTGPSSKKECDDAHKSVGEAVAAHAQARADNKSAAQEARHSFRNVRQVFHALADKLGRRGNA